MGFTLPTNKVLLSYLTKQLVRQPLAIIAIALSTLTYCHQRSMDQLQAEFINSQGESLRVTLSRNHMNDEDGPNYIQSDKFSGIETMWDLEIDNTSIQTPTTVSKWKVYTKIKEKFNEHTGSDFATSEYTPFYKENGEPLPLPFVIPAGNTLRIRMKVDLSVTQEAAEKLYVWRNERLSLKEAESVYSFELQRKGTPHDIFGNVGFDNDGFSLVVPKSEAEKVHFPILRLDLQSNRGKTYSSIAGWYYIMFIFPDDKWAEGNREWVNHPDPFGPWPNAEPATSPPHPQ